MQCSSAVVVCVSAFLICQVVLGHPRALEESRTDISKRGNIVKRDTEERVWISGNPGSDDDASDSAYAGVPRPKKKKTEEDKRKIARSADQDQEEQSRIPKIPAVEEEKARPERGFRIADGAEEKKEDATLGSSIIQLSVPESISTESNKDDDSARSKKSTSMREMTFHPAPTTTVCIQVRSDHQHPSQVVCGPQVGDDKKEEKPSSPRYSFQPAPSQYYNPMYGQEQFPLPNPAKPNFYIRASPQDPSRPAPASGQRPQQMMIPSQQIPSQGPSMSPKAARGPPQMMFSIRRNEDDNSLKQSEVTPPTPAQPLRIIPQGPPPSVVVHKQYYQAAPLPAFATNLIAPAPTPLRFNCAMDPQYIQQYGSSMFRNADPSPVLPGYIPLGGEVIIPGAPSSRMAQGPQDPQGYYYDPEGRSAQADEAGSPYGYPAEEAWVGTTFVGEDGQLYRIDESSQGRSAGEDQMSQWEQEYLRASGGYRSRNSMSYEELRSKFDKQQDRLKQLQQQLKDIEQRAAVDVEEKKDSTKAATPAETPKDASPVRDTPSESPEEPKKPNQGKPSKRHSSRPTAK